MNNKFNVFILFLIINLAGCNNEPKTWQLSKNITLDSVNPIGLAFTGEGLWLSDGDRNRLVLVDENGKTLRTVDSLERPMHIDSDGQHLYVPLYGEDIIAKISRKAVLVLPIKDSLDAPAGISVLGQERAIADFYNHRILYSSNGTNSISFGVEGKEEGEFYYPTDVQITEEYIWVADAYNNRVQVFTKAGKFVRAIGATEKMNAATGIFVSRDEVFVTDFENDRILVFDHEGTLKQVITEGVDKPTDVLVREGKLYVANYKSGVLQILEQRRADN